MAENNTQKDPVEPKITPQKETAPDTVTLSRDAFNEMMARISNLEETSRLVLATTDKNKLNKIEELRRSGKLVKDVKLRTVDGKTIVGWKTTLDEVYFADGKLIENQKIKVIFEDKSDREMTMRQWATIPTYETYEVIRESRVENGDYYLTVRRPDGKEVEINILYVN